jgi:hypothetical protein
MSSDTYASPSFPDQAREHVFEYISKQLKETGSDVEFTMNDVFIVWFNYTLYNWKALVATKLRDQMYYEVTRDSMQRATYVDAYNKVENVVMLDEDR